MSEQFQIPYTPDFQGDKREVVQSGTHVPVDADSIYCVVQSDIFLNRQVEILDGWRKLWDFVRDGNHMLGDGPLYASRDINAPPSATRITVDIASVTTTDIVIGIGVNVNADASGGTSANQMIGSAFRMIRDAARETFFVKQ